MHVGTGLDALARHAPRLWGGDLRGGEIDGRLFDSGARLLDLGVGEIGLRFAYRYLVWCGTGGRQTPSGFANPCLCLSDLRLRLPEAFSGRLLCGTRFGHLSFSGCRLLARRFEPSIGGARIGDPLLELLP